MSDNYPNGYCITNYLLCDDINATVVEMIKAFLPESYRDKEDIWIEFTQHFMSPLFRKVRNLLLNTFTCKEYGLTVRNEKNHKLFEVDRREFSVFQGLVVYHVSVVLSSIFLSIFFPFLFLFLSSFIFSFLFGICQQLHHGHMTLRRRY
jgi:hypothetical protein